MRGRTAGAFRWSIAAASLAVATACGPRAPEPGRMSVVSALRGDGDAGFARALAPRAFAFPEDHGPHPAFRTEWWYVTGHLDGASGARFGFELTFFRNALAPAVPPRASDLGTRDVYMAHFALTDVRARRFTSAERVERGAGGLAGATARPFAVWLDDWSLRARGGAGAFPLRLVAADGDGAIDLVLEPGKPPVAQGDHGLSRKGAEPGNASYYYSLTRLPAHGTVTASGRRHDVRGTAWIDREWSTSALGPGIAGWDWFALQLADGRDVMFYRLRRTDGSADPFSAGSIVAADGSSAPLAAADVVATPQGTWRSPRSGMRYPARWRLRVPRAGLDVVLEPVLQDQELSGTIAYWEGAADVTGSARGRAYVEMTGAR